MLRDGPRCLADLARLWAHGVVQPHAAMRSLPRSGGPRLGLAAKAALDLPRRSAVMAALAASTVYVLGASRFVR